jgi:hypothetical protein
MEEENATFGSQEAKPEGGDSFWSRYGPNVLLGVLILYVILLGIGTYAELTHNESILNWWIFK